MMNRIKSFGYLLLSILGVGIGLLILWSFVQMPDFDPNIILIGIGIATIFFTIRSLAFVGYYLKILVTGHEPIGPFEPSQDW